MTRDEIKDIFIFAGMVWKRLNNGKGRHIALQQHAVRIMNICEQTIGQQWYRPDRQSRNELMKDE